jgi:hypothetical protein
MTSFFKVLLGLLGVSFLVLAGCDSAGNTGDPPVVTHTMTWNVTMSGYTDSAVGYVLLRLDPSDPSTAIAIAAEGAGTTDTSGYVQVQVSGEQGNHYGVTIFQDTDASGDLTAGDMVWGTGGGSYTYFHWSSTKPLENDETFLIPDWDNYGSVAINAF